MEQSICDEEGFTVQPYNREARKPRKGHKPKVIHFAVGLVAVATIAGACGSSKSSSGNAHTPPGLGASLTGAGYTTPTSGNGTKVAGGTVYFAEGGGPPNYIFPMTGPQVCNSNNVGQFSAMLYRPLYWYGNFYSPTVDLGKSIGQQPVWSNGDKTVTITLNALKWSDGEQMTSRNVAMYVNLYKADPSNNYCGYVGGLFPDNVVSMSTPNAQTIVFNLDKAYNPTWFLYNELSQITPLPLAWDRTSLSQPAPSADNGSLPDSTKAGAEAVYKFLDAQSNKVASWASSPIWSVVDGPFKLASFTNTGEVTLMPNADYSGTPKPSIAKLVEVPFTDDSAIFNEIRSAGTSALTVSPLPKEYAAQESAVASEGYTDNKAASYSFNFLILNMHNPKVGPIFSQPYFRQALQHLVDQDGWIRAFLDNTAVPTYGPIPSSPPSPLASASGGTNPYPFSVSAASQLLSKNGWKVAAGGTTTCARPGTGPGECGAGITAGEAIAFNLDYRSGVSSLGSEMNDLASNAKRVGVNIELTTHPFGDVVGAISQCSAGQPTCNWTAANPGGGWVYGPDFLPTGESLFMSGSSGNYGNYSNPLADNLINASIYGGNEQQALAAYAQYMEQQLPVIFEPTSVGTYGSAAGTLVDSKLGGYAANAFGYMNPEDWYFTK